MECLPLKPCVAFSSVLYSVVGGVLTFTCETNMKYIAENDSEKNCLGLYRL